MVVTYSLRPSLAEVIEARERLAGVTVRTPLLQLHGSTSIWIKPEVLQPIGSFKLRGIYNAVAALDPVERKRGVCTVSSGNTAQALSWSARRFGITARAIMPHTAPETKIEATRAYGGVPDLRDPESAFSSLYDGSYHDEPENFIHPVASRHVLAGNGTIALEILEDLPEVNTIYVPIGGGGLSCGIAAALKAKRPQARVIGVQPVGCTPVIAGLAAGKPVIVPIDTFCDGVAVSFMFPEMEPVLRELLDDIVTVEEEDVFATIQRLALKNKIVAEGAGALAVAAALRTPEVERGRTVAFVSGGSIDPDKLANILATGRP
jgi:threonine dehydratase